ncbi:MAG TPA: hypothetical protein VMT89_19170 [Candidatus Acidoferrales bacterium]|nr:hypothetical protein [Candidatus Acidoferrales bacterium]
MRRRRQLEAGLDCDAHLHIELEADGDGFANLVAECNQFANRDPGGDESADDNSQQYFRAERNLHLNDVADRFGNANCDIDIDGQ